MMCSKGCGRPAKVRGMCRPHYNANRKLLERHGQWTPRMASIGTARRLRALNALGYLQHDLASRLDCHYTWVNKLMANHRTRVNPDTALRVAELYNRLSMTPGPSESARRAAQRKGWPPPLAWDDDTIDDPDAVPDGQPHRGDRKWVPFPELYAELRDLGYSDVEMLRRLSIRAESLYRQLMRYRLPVSEQLSIMASRDKHLRDVS